MTDRHASPENPGAAWDLRVARAVPFAAVCTLIAAAGHALVGGGDVALSSLATGFLAMAALATLLGGRERALLPIAALLGAGQIGLHCLFHFLGAHPDGHQGMAQVAGRLLCNESAHGGLTVVPMDSTELVSAAGLDPQAYAPAPHAAAAGLLGMSPAMLLGHLAAAVVAGWWLRRGEQALWRILRVAATAAREWAAPLRTAFALLAALLLGSLGTRRPARTPRLRAGHWRLPGAAALQHCVIRRGPPAAAFAR